MKKFLCCTLLMLSCMMVSAMSQMKAYSPPEPDIGYALVATLSVDGQTVVSFDQQYNIVELQTPVMMNMEVITPSAQVVDAYSCSPPMGEVSMMLVSYMWPNDNSETMILREDYTNSYAFTGAGAYSFTASLTGHT